MKTLLLMTITGMAYAFTPPSNECARTVVEKSIQAMGGQTRIDAVNNIQFTGYGYRNMAEQSERFEGPFLIQSFTFTQLQDRKNKLIRHAVHDQLFNMDMKYLVDTEALAVHANGKTGPWQQNQSIQDELFLNPLSVLQTALESAVLTCLSDTVIHHIRNNRIRFTWNNRNVDVSINAFTSLVTCIQLQKPYNDAFLNVWGDSRKTVFYSFWDLLDNGVHYPMQRDTYFNGQLWEVYVVRSTKINQPLSPDSLRIPSEIKTAALGYDKMIDARVSKMMEGKIELAKDVWMIPGFCTSTIVKQGHELTIVEAPHSSAYTEKIVDIARQLYPDVPIKNVITTSDAWLHCGGVRTGANTANLIVLDHNKPVVESILRAPYITTPDAWQKRKVKKPAIQLITTRTKIGTGANRIELIPFNTESGERMMMVYYPEHKLLYASDLYQPGNWQKHYTLEVVQAIDREKLDVDNVYAMHSKPVKLSEIRALVAGH